MAGMLRVISANRLRDGGVVYFGGSRGWVERFGMAEVYESAEALDSGIARAKEDERSNLVLEIAPVDAVREAGDLRPAHLREEIRAAGPTVRPDLGKQADHGRSRRPGRSD